ncbi:Myosin type-2 heavy chain 1 [Phlyctochytrium bullatum]|nr:Myosin type-2 heavy chain 1 [Phlyctochytrium bullatum]
MDATAIEKALQEYEKDTYAYFPDEMEGWILGKLRKKIVRNDHLWMDFVIVGTNQGVTFEGTISQLAKNNMSELPPLKNPEIMDLADDLAQLSYLHEPAVFWGVKNRFLKKYIYTYSGMVLIAMNPFEKIDMYSVETMREYAGKIREELEPHVFAIAEEAYRAMLRGNDQSIIVSGESGAGKTQSTKYIMRYFATVDSLSKMDDLDLLMRPDTVAMAVEGGKSEIEQAVLATNPILEAFGNAKTTRNDNSSRFGKFIELFFSPPESGSVRITGARIRTYLLERSRLVFQPFTERNYHIFYQLCAAAPAAEREELCLGPWQQFHYLNQGKAGVVKNFDDAAEFAATQKALSTIGIPVAMQWSIFRVCAALLHLGNIRIVDTGKEACDIAESDPSLTHACRLLQLDKAEFRKWLTKRLIVTRGEKFTKDLKADQATVVRDSVAKFVYTRLFDWLVKIVNRNLKRDSGAAEKFIGVLDIYGFEHFEVNSFEQFCINYANEKLQQEFNAHVFRLEQELYMREEIVWTMIEFNDNQPCIDLIEGKLGILDLLDEESRMPAGADASFVAKLNQRFAVPTQRFYEKPRFDPNGFTVRHYAVDVTYSSEGFIEKNKDTVSVEQHETLAKSGLEFLRELVELDEDDPIMLAAAAQSKALERSAGLVARRTTTGKSRKPTLGSMFKASLVQLMETIRATESHYIRCIKPNMAKAPFGFEGPMVLSQLRACGVLETIKISCAGYPSKMTHKQFTTRYDLLVNSKHWNLPDRELCELIVRSIISDPDKYQFGLTQVFLRAGQIAYFENRRTERQTFLLVLCQKNFRRHMARKRYVELRASTVRIQTSVRGWLARKHVRFMRETRAATIMQKIVRGWLNRTSYQRTRAAVIKVQSTYRMYCCKMLLLAMRQTRASITIQSVWRSYVVRKEYRRVRRLIIYLQSCLRRKVARRLLAALKVEARSVGKLKELNYSLETKVVALSQQLQAKAEENRVLTEKVATLEASVTQWKDRFAKLESGKKAAEGELGVTAQSLQKELATVTEARDGLLKERERLLHALKKKEDELTAKEDENKRVAEKLRISQGNKRMSMISASVTDDPVVQALRNENMQLKRLLAQQPQAAAPTAVVTPPTPANGPTAAAATGSLERPPLPSSTTGSLAPPGAPGTPQNSPRPAFLSEKINLPAVRPRPMARRANSFIDSGILEDAERARLRELAENLAKAEAKAKQDANRRQENMVQLEKAQEEARQEAEARKQAEARAEALELKERELKAQAEALAAAKAKIEAKMEEERVKHEEEQKAQRAALEEAVQRVRRGSRDSSISRASSDHHSTVSYGHANGAIYANGRAITPPVDPTSPINGFPPTHPHSGHPHVPPRRFPASPRPDSKSPTPAHPHPPYHPGVGIQSPTSQGFSPSAISPMSSHSGYQRTPGSEMGPGGAGNSYFPAAAGPRHTPPLRTMSGSQMSESGAGSYNQLPSPSTTTSTVNVDGMHGVPPVHGLRGQPLRTGSGTYSEGGLVTAAHPPPSPPLPSNASSSSTGATLPVAEGGGFPRRPSDPAYQPPPAGAMGPRGSVDYVNGVGRAPPIGPRSHQLHYTNPAVHQLRGSASLPARMISLEKDSGSAEQRALEAPDLVKEIQAFLVNQLKVPKVGSKTFSRKEVFFPAHLIGYVVRAMLQYDMTIKLQNMMSVIVEDIFNVGVHSDNDMCPLFWISNVQELISIIATLYFAEAKRAPMGTSGRGTHVHVLRKLRGDLDSLMTQLMSGYMEDTKRHVASMSVGAILDTQDLANMKSETTTSFWSLFQTNVTGTGTAGTLTTLKEYLSGLNDIMEAYFVTSDHRDHILNELVRVVGVTSFNGLLKKRNFTNYKRGSQIQYNVSRLEEWCLKNRVSQGVDYLQRMFQSSKILTLPKMTAEDAEVVYETGYMLNRNQVRHLLQDYPSGDPDSPMSNTFMRIIARRAEETENIDSIFLSLDPEPAYPEPMPQPVAEIETFVPSGLNLVCVGKVIAAGGF